MSIFRTYDLRGIYGKDLTAETAKKVGQSLGTFLKGKEDVCVGYDTRSSSPVLFDNFVSGLISTGCNVISLGMVPNPFAYFFAWKNKTFGCHITASHNPVEWNGFKIFKPNGVSFVEEIKKLEEIFNSEKFIIKRKGEVKEKKDVTKDYTNFLKKKIGKVKGKVVVDFLGGAGTKATEVFKKMGLDIIALHDKPDASLYGFHRLEPWGKLLGSVKKTVKKKKADFGVALDCDVDRSVFIDSAGRYIDPSIITGIFIENILKRKKGKVIATFDCATELEKFSNKLGGKLIWWRVGHGFIEQKCVKENALFAGEQSSHYYFNEIYPFSDGILSILSLAKILNEVKKKFEELISQIKFYPVVKLYIDAGTDEKKLDVIEKIKIRFPNATDIMDGIKIKLNKIEWALIRASQTLPEINLCVEAKNRKRLKELVEKYTKIIEEELKE